MIVRVDSSLKSKASQLAKAEGKSLSELVRELLVNYTKERDMNAYIDGLWDRIGKGFTQKGILEKDIDRAIRQVRSEND
jgi:hypothetical protein